MVARGEGCGGGQSEGEQQTQASNYGMKSLGRKVQHREYGRWYFNNVVCIDGS